MTEPRTEHTTAEEREGFLKMLDTHFPGNQFERWQGRAMRRLLAQVEALEAELAEARLKAASGHEVQP